MCWVYRLYSSLVTVIRKNRLIFWLLFKYIPPASKYGSYWDWTTLILKNNLHRFVKPSMSLLDMGTGPYGVLSFYIANTYPSCKITGADYCSELVAYAKQNQSDSKVEFVHSDLFNSLTGIYDIVMFNAPYISKDKGTALGIFANQLSEKRWQGGTDGSETITRFIEDCPKYLHTDAKLLLGVNHFFLKPSRIKSIIQESNMQLVSEYNNHLTQAGLYILTRKYDE